VKSKSENLLSVRRHLRDRRTLASRKAKGQKKERKIKKRSDPEELYPSNARVRKILRLLSTDRRGNPQRAIVGKGEEGEALVLLMESRAAAGGRYSYKRRAKKQR